MDEDHEEHEGLPDQVADSLRENQGRLTDEDAERLEALQAARERFGVDTEPAGADATIEGNLEEMEVLTAFFIWQTPEGGWVGHPGLPDGTEIVLQKEGPFGPNGTPVPEVRRRLKIQREAHTIDMTAGMAVVARDIAAQEAAQRTMQVQMMQAAAMQQQMENRRIQEVLAASGGLKGDGIINPFAPNRQGRRHPPG